MKQSINWLLLLICCFTISCNYKEKRQVKTEVINYSKIDSSISHLSEAAYQRLDENWMSKRIAKFKELGIDKSMNDVLDWPTNSIIEANLDEDNIKDYIVIVKSQFHPRIDIHYAIIAVLGKSFKSYEIPDCSYMTMDLEQLHEESKDYTEYELPQIILKKEENVTTIYCIPHRNVDYENPYYYDTEKDKFEIVAYD
jgi:hypothetical protein